MHYWWDEMMDIGDTKLEKDILEYIEAKEISQQRELSFETSVKSTDIEGSVLRQYAIDETDELYQHYKKGIEEAIKSLIKKRKIIKLLKNGNEVGYRSRSAEITRLLYKLRLKTQKREYLDVATLKFARRDKIIPAWDEDLISLDLAKIRKFLSDQNILTNPYDIDPIAVLIRSLEKTKYRSLSDFQVESYLAIAEQLTNPPHGVVITATTGAGKTLAFLLTPLLYTIASALNDIKGTKVLFIYPRNTLAEDQYRTIESILSKINLQLKEEFRDIPHLPPPILTVEKDIRGTSRIDQDRIYNKLPDFLITNTETLKKRLMYFRTHKALKNIKFVVFDEIHLYYGMTGTNTIFLIKRLQSLLRKYHSHSVFIGASATIAEPRDFCKTLFSLSKKPVHIASETFKPIVSGHTHHLFLRPIAERDALSVAVDATSCIIHNRRDGLVKEREKKLASKASKAICFADSLDTVGSWNQYLNDFEGTKGYKKSPPPNVGYIRYFKPCGRKDYCTGYVLTDCPYYRSGSCWTFSLDDGKNILSVNDNKYRGDAIRSTAMTAKSEDIEEELFSDPGTPWFLDAIIASPVLEVGVDIDNVKEILLLKAIKSPSSYRQKIGRAGREIGSESFAVSIMSNSLMDNYYFRNYLKLVSGALAPLPLNEDNIDVASSHLICGIIDFLASEDVDIFSVQYLHDPVKNFLDAKSIIGDRKAQIAAYLRGIYDKDALINESISIFLKILDEMIDKSLFELIDFKIDGATPTYVELASRLSGKERSRHIGSIEGKIKKIQSDLHLQLKDLTFIREKKSALMNVIGEIPPRYRNELKEILRGIEKLFEVDIDKEGVAEKLKILIEKIHKEKSEYSHIVTLLRELRDKIVEIDFSEIKEAEKENLQLETINTFIANAREEFQYGIYLDAVLRAHPYLPSPWVPAANLYEHSKKKKVMVKIPYRHPVMEDIGTTFSLLYPGKHSWRYGTPIKVPIGKWPDVGVGEVSVSMHNLEFLREVETNTLPKEITSNEGKIAIYSPKILNCKQIKTPEDVETSQLPICLICGRAYDGDEFCPHSMGRESTYFSKTLPKGEPLIYSHVRYDDEKRILTPKAPFSNLILAISFSKKVDVLRVLYGFERYVSGDVYRLYYDKLLGDAYMTDGIIYKLNDVQNKVSYLISNLDKSILRDLRLMQFAIEFYDFLKSKYFSIWDAMVAFKAMLLLFIEEKGIPRSYEEIEMIIALSCECQDELTEVLDRLYEQRGKDRPKRVEEIFQTIKEFKLGDFQNFMKKVYMHTLSHYIYVSTMLLLGVDEKEIGYYFDADKESIIIFDAVDGGNGCARTIHDEKSLLSLDVAKNLEKTRSEISPVSPHPRDLLSYLEELTIGCATAQADSILLKILCNESKLIKRAEESDDDRFNILTEVKNKYGIDEFELSHLDSIIKQRLHIPLAIAPTQDDIFFSSFVPEYVMQKLSEENKKKMLPEYEELDPTEAFGRLYEIVKDALSICINACPSCLLISNCIEGRINSKHTLDRRVIEFMVDKAKKPITIIFNGNVISTAEKVSDLLKKDEGISYIEGSFDQKENILACAYSLLGQRINNKFVRLANFTLYQGKFAVKLEMV